MLGISIFLCYTFNSLHICVGFPLFMAYSRSVLTGNTTFCHFPEFPGHDHARSRKWRCHLTDFERDVKEPLRTTSCLAVTVYSAPYIGLPHGTAMETSVCNFLRYPQSSGQTNKRTTVLPGSYRTTYALVSGSLYRFQTRLT